MNSVDMFGGRERFSAVFVSVTATRTERTTFIELGKIRRLPINGIEFGTARLIEPRHRFQQSERAVDYSNVHVLF